MKTIIYDSMNRLVWVEGEKPETGSKDVTKRHYGHSAKRFESNVQARAYAIKLAKLNNGRVYDKYYGKYIKRTSSAPRQQGLIFPRQRGLRFGLSLMSGKRMRLF